MKTTLYALVILNIIICSFWIRSSIQRDDAKELELFWRNKYISTRAMLGISIMQTDLVLEASKPDLQLMDEYCSSKEKFMVNLAKNYNSFNKAEN